MKAIEKIEALSLKVVHAEAARLRPSLALETVYRWRQALNARRGVSDEIKQLLIEATRDSDHPLAWEDFNPGRPARVAEARS